MERSADLSDLAKRRLVPEQPHAQPAASLRAQSRWAKLKDAVHAAGPHAELLTDVQAQLAATGSLREAAENLNMNDLKTLLRNKEISLPQFVELSSALRKAAMAAPLEEETEELTSSSTHSNRSTTTVGAGRRQSRQMIAK